MTVERMLELLCIYTYLDHYPEAENGPMGERLYELEKEFKKQYG